MTARVRIDDNELRGYPTAYIVAGSATFKVTATGELAPYRANKFWSRDSVHNAILARLTPDGGWSSVEIRPILCGYNIAGTARPLSTGIDELCELARTAFLSQVEYYQGLVESVYMRPTSD